MQGAVGSVQGQEGAEEGWRWQVGARAAGAGPGLWGSRGLYPMTRAPPGKQGQGRLLGVRGTVGEGRF